MKRRSRELNSPDITPLIDVIFLLLLFFILSTVFKKEELALLLNLPQTTEGQQTLSQQTKNIVIELSENELAFNGIKIEESELDAKLAEVEDKNRPIDLRIDKTVVYDRIIKVLDRLKHYELTNLSLITEQ